MTTSSPASMGGPLSEAEPLPGEVPMTDADVTEVFSCLRIALTAPWEPIAVFGTDASADLERLQVEVQRLRLRDARLTNENEDLKFNRNEVFKYKNELAAKVGVLEGQLATARALHQPKTIYTEWHEAPVESSKRTICERCTGGDPDDYYTQMVLWPCENAKALGLDGGGSGES